MVTCATATFVGSSTEVAVTVPVPVVRPAVNTPLLSTVPIEPAVDQETPLVELVSVALNCIFDPAFTVKAEGVIATVIVLGVGGVVVLTVTVALADFVISCIEAAVTVPPPTVTAVNNPLALMVPSVEGTTVHATPDVEFATFGVNCTVLPTLVVLFVGVIDTVIGSGAVTRFPDKYGVSSATAFDEWPTLEKAAVPSLPQYEAIPLPPGCIEMKGVRL